MEFNKPVFVSYTQEASDKDKMKSLIQVAREIANDLKASKESDNLMEKYLKIQKDISDLELKLLNKK